MDIAEQIRILAEQLRWRLINYGFNVEYSKFLIISSRPVPQNMALFSQLHIVIDLALPGEIMILPVTLAQVRDIELADCTPETEAEYDKVIEFETHKRLIKYVYNVTQDWLSDFSKTPPLQSRVSIRLPHLTVRQALKKLAE